MARFRKQDLGGKGKDSWSFYLRIMPENLDGLGHTYLISFCSTGMTRAKTIILDHVKKTLRRFKNKEELIVVLLGTPYLSDGITGDGDRMLRLRHKYADGDSIFKVKKPNTAFTVGYGETRRNYP